MHIYVIFPMQALGLFELSGSPDYAFTRDLSRFLTLFQHII